MAVQYSDLINKNGTIYNAQTGQGYPTPAALAADLGISPTAIQWNSIQADPNYTPGTGFNYGGQGAPAPAPAPQQQPAQTTNGLPSTGSAQLDALQGQLGSYVDQLAASGKTINPNIELSPSTVQQFLDQAKSEIHPYYASQIDSMKNEIGSSLQNMQRQYDLAKSGQEADFKKNLNDTREQLAAGGAAQSGFRGQQEQQLQQGAQRSIQSLTNSAAGNAGSTLYNAAQNIGSRNISDLGNGSFGTPTVSTAGAGGFGTSGSTSFYNPTDITGQVEYQQNADTRNLQDFLTQQEVAKRSLSFTGQ